MDEENFIRKLNVAANVLKSAFPKSKNHFDDSVNEYLDKTEEIDRQCFNK